MKNDFFAGCTPSADRGLELDVATAARVGIDGASVESASIDAAGHLLIVLNDGRTIDAGRVTAKSGLIGIARFDTAPAVAADPQLYIATAKGVYGYFPDHRGQPLTIREHNTIGLFFCPAGSRVWEMEELKLDLGVNLDFLNDLPLGGTFGKSYIGKRIVLYGDSITNDQGLEPGTYAGYVKSKFGTSDVICHGHSGEMLGSLAEDRSYDSLTDDQQIGFVVSLEPDLLIVQGGVSDYWHAVPLGDYYGSVENEAYVRTTTGGLRYLLHHLTKNLPHKTRVLFVTPPPGMFHDVLDTEPNALGLRMEDYVRRYRDICAEYHVPVCDAWANGGWSPHRETLELHFTTDGTHLSPAGYDRLTDLLLAAATVHC